MWMNSPKLLQGYIHITTITNLFMKKKEVYI